MVRFGLNLGLNNLKFNQEAISDQIDLIGSTRSSRFDRVDQVNLTAKFRIIGKKQIPHQVGENVTDLGHVLIGQFWSDLDSI